MKKKAIVIPLVILVICVMGLLFVLLAIKRHNYINRNQINSTILSDLEADINDIMGTNCYFEKIDKIEYGGQISCNIYYLYFTCTSPDTSIPKDSGGLNVGYYVEKNYTVLRIPERDYTEYQCNCAKSLCSVIDLSKKIYPA